jgi:hypothetical protein
LVPARRAVQPSGRVRDVSASATLLTSSELAESQRLVVLLSYPLLRDEGISKETRMTEEPSDQLSWKIPWKDVISSAVPLLSILGLALYALSSYA